MYALADSRYLVPPCIRHFRHLRLEPVNESTYSYVLCLSNKGKGTNSGRKMVIRQCPILKEVRFLDLAFVI